MDNGPGRKGLENRKVSHLSAMYSLPGILSTLGLILSPQQWAQNVARREDISKVTQAHTSPGEGISIPNHDEACRLAPLLGKEGNIFINYRLRGNMATGIWKSGNDAHKWNWITYSKAKSKKLFSAGWKGNSGTCEDLTPSARDGISLQHQRAYPRIYLAYFHFYADHLTLSIPHIILHLFKVSHLLSVHSVLGTVPNSSSGGTEGGALGAGIRYKVELARVPSLE